MYVARLSNVKAAENVSVDLIFSAGHCIALIQCKV